jgi:hypothetical protein
MQSFADFAVWLLGGLVSIVGWFVKENVDRIANIEEKYNSLHEHYVKKNDFEKFEDQLWRRFDKLEDKLSDKLG